MSGHSKSHVVPPGLMSLVGVNVLGIIAVISLAGVVFGWSRPGQSGTALFVAGIAALVLARARTVGINWLDLSRLYSSPGERVLETHQHGADLYTLEMVYTGIVAIILGMALYLFDVESGL
jgi:hypothetical protein